MQVVVGGWGVLTDKHETVFIGTHLEATRIKQYLESFSLTDGNFTIKQGDPHWKVVAPDEGTFQIAKDKENAVILCTALNKELCRRAADDKHITETFHELPKEDKAMRFNEGKPQLNYILSCDVAMTGLARVMEFGAIKYEKDNWKKGLDPDEIMDSLLRHLMAYRTGEVLDPESKLPHVDHIQFNAMALATFGEREVGQLHQDN